MPKECGQFGKGETKPVESLSLGGMFRLFTLENKEEKEGFQEVKSNKRGKKKKTVWRPMPVGKPYSIVKEWNRYGKLGKDWEEEQEEEDSPPELLPSSSEEEGEGNKKKEGKKKKLKTKKEK